VREQAGGKTLALLYVPGATGVVDLQSTRALLLRIDRQRQFYQQQHSQRILFV
jgi:hypothetical protein